VPRLRHRPPSPTSKSLQFRLRGELAASIASVRTEIAEAKSELIRWSVGSIFASVGMFAAITPRHSSASPRKSTFASGELFCHEMAINQLLIMTS